ncbi:site-specific integrase [Siphonobacter sp. SORGH_AS_1065]|uniref:tyrosine-type recombinase/integrase n=1 Tax=Siphonobacter sp. SORGH_AS_1065 TaxID=3041795 RepID=UPI00278AF2E3|nr:site-specific integrase [Siphonobacter sp. SORGH_AS_1065]MDQ1087172.1 integrase [Siphonobacter sp. SORGH_AS_1065]
MDVSKAEVRLAHDPTKTDKVSVKLRVIYQRDSRRYGLPIKDGVFVTREEFTRLVKCHSGNYAKSAERIRLLYDSIRPHIQRAKSVIEKLPVFSFESFKEEFYKQDQETATDELDLLQAISKKAQLMKKQGRIGNASNYELAGKSLARYVNSLSKEERKDIGLPPLPRTPSPVIILLFTQVNAALLADYEAWMRKYGKSPQKKGAEPGPATATTIGIYLRHVRAVFNDAIEQGIIGKENYPFGKKKYAIPASRNKKKALSRDEMDLLKQYKPSPNPFEQRSYDLFFFSYYCNGMNMTDIVNLRWKDVDAKAGVFHFVREKTQRTKKENQTHITVQLRPATWEIIERWSEGDRRGDQYVFPFLESGLSPEKEKSTISQLVKVTNKHMRKIAQKLGIQSDIVTYSARHTFATTLLRSEAPLGFISQTLGHSDIKTTQAYLGSFDDEQTKKYLDNL